jgi:hypothetical protein
MCLDTWKSHNQCLDIGKVDNIQTFNFSYACSGCRRPSVHTRMSVPDLEIDRFVRALLALKLKCEECAQVGRTVQPIVYVPPNILARLHELRQVDELFRLTA